MQHQFTCPHIVHKKNCGGEKHKHLLNIARTLLFQAGLPIKFWGECVVTAAFLINQTPSSSLKDLTLINRCIKSNQITRSSESLDVCALLLKFLH